MRAGKAAILIVLFSAPVTADAETAMYAADGRREAVYLAQSVSYPEMDVVRFLGPVLLRDRNVGRVYYRAACSAERKYDVTFPRLAVRRQPNDAAGVEAARAVFQDSNRVTVSEDGPIVRIRVGDVPDAIMKVHIAQLQLDEEAQYNIIDAISVIFNSAEVQAAERKLGLRQPPTIIDHLVQPPMEEYPHLPPVLTDLTVDEALDRVATTFNLIVFYGANSCPADAAHYANYAILDPALWTPDSYWIMRWLKAPWPTNPSNFRCQEAGEDFECEFDMKAGDTMRHVKVHAVWTDAGWRYSLRQ